MAQQLQRASSQMQMSPPHQQAGLFDSPPYSPSSPRGSGRRAGVERDTSSNSLDAILDGDTASMQGSPQVSPKGGSDMWGLRHQGSGTAGGGADSDRPGSSSSATRPALTPVVEVLSNGKLGSSGNSSDGGAIGSRAEGTDTVIQGFQDASPALDMEQLLAPARSERGGAAGTGVDGAPDVPLSSTARDPPELFRGASVDRLEQSMPGDSDVALEMITSATPLGKSLASPLATQGGGGDLMFESVDTALSPVHTTAQRQQGLGASDSGGDDNGNASSFTFQGTGSGQRIVVASFVDESQEHVADSLSASQTQQSSGSGSFREAIITGDDGTRRRGTGEANVDQLIQQEMLHTSHATGGDETMSGFLDDAADLLR